MNLKFNKIYKIASSISLIAILVGCSGSDEKEPSETVTELNNRIIANAVEFDSSEVVSAYDAILEESYSGHGEKASLEFSNLQTFFKRSAGFERLDRFGIRWEAIEGLLDRSSINKKLFCYYYGSAQVSGTYNPDIESTISVNYNDCEDTLNTSDVNGKSTIKVITNTDDEVEHFSFLNAINFKRTAEGPLYTISGYFHYHGLNAMNSEGHYTHDTVKNLLIKNLESGEETIIKSTQTYQYNEDGSFSYEEEGEIGISGLGIVSFSYNTGYDASYELHFEAEFVGESTISLKVIESDYLKIMEDSDNDGEFETGTFLRYLSELYYTDPTLVTFVSSDEMSLPPYVSGISLRHYDISTNDKIVIEPGYITDPDTPNESLSISYVWYLNGEEIVGETTNILPSNIAVYGDELSVVMLVSDGVNNVATFPLFITLQDSPEEIQVTGVPEQINAGDLIEFHAQITDPDVRNGESISATLVSGPAGATIDVDGLVTWQVASDMYFPIHEYYFEFSNADVESDKLPLTLQVFSDSDWPVTRSGIDVPVINYSVHVGDFRGDGVNEILSTDSQNKVFLITLDNENYEVNWMYPFALPSGGQVRQVLGANVDSDEQLEIIVITSNGINVIYALDEPAKLLYSAENITFAALADSNQDGTLEVAILSSDSAYYYESDMLTVFSFNNPEEELFSTEISGTKEIVFGNVDDDSSLEIITNSGLVYDGITGVNEWLSSSSFGTGHVASGDLDGDGVEEIVGADHWGDIKVISAKSKEQLFSQDNFNTCSVMVGNVDEDAEKEVLIGDCQWGDITAYDFKNNTLEKLWSINMQGHGSKSIALGDSDNDGELEVHWGTGQSSSGENSFIVADLLENNIALKDINISPQLDSFYSAGWAGNDAIFFIPSTNNGYDGSRLLTMSLDGAMKLSNEISNNWDNSSFSTVGDFDNDGSMEVVVPTTQYYDSSLAVVQPDTLESFWAFSDDSDGNLGVVKPFDFNADGNLDVFYTMGSKVKAMDVTNQSIIGTVSLDTYVRDIALATIEQQNLLVVASDSKLILYTSGTSSFSELDVQTQSCIRIEFGNFDNDSQLELACLNFDGGYSYNGGSSDSISIYEISDDKLSKSLEITLPVDVLDIAVDTSTNMEQGLFLATIDGDSFYDYENKYQIGYVNNVGKLEWLSPGLIGAPSRQSLKLSQDGNKSKLMYSTISSMNIVTKINE